MSNLRIAYKLAAAFGLLILIVGLTSGASYLMAARTTSASANNSAGSDVLNAFDNAVESIITARSDIRTYVLERDPTQVEAYRHDLSAAKDALVQARKRAADYRLTGDVLQGLDKVEVSFSAWMSKVGDVIASTPMTDDAAVSKSVALFGSDASKAARAAIAEATSDLKQKLKTWTDTDQDLEDASLNDLKLVQAVGLVAALFVAALIAWLVLTGVVEFH